MISPTSDDAESGSGSAVRAFAPDSCRDTGGRRDYKRTCAWAPVRDRKGVRNEWHCRRWLLLRKAFNGTELGVLDRDGRVLGAGRETAAISGYSWAV
jgi:hypothetical protein